MIPTNNKKYANEHPRGKKPTEDTDRMAKYEPGNGKKDTRRLKDILKGSNYSGPVKILPNETFEEALNRILEEQKKKGN